MIEDTLYIRKTLLCLFGFRSKIAGRFCSGRIWSEENVEKLLVLHMGLCRDENELVNVMICSNLSIVTDARPTAIRFYRYYSKPVIWIKEFRQWNTTIFCERLCV